MRWSTSAATITSKSSPFSRSASAPAFRSISITRSHASLALSAASGSPSTPTTWQPLSASNLDRRPCPQPSSSTRFSRPTSSAIRPVLRRAGIGFRMEADRPPARAPRCVGASRCARPWTTRAALIRRQGNGEYGRLRSVGRQTPKPRPATAVLELATGLTRPADRGRSPAATRTAQRDTSSSDRPLAAGPARAVSPAMRPVTPIIAKPKKNETPATTDGNTRPPSTRRSSPRR